MKGEGRWYQALELLRFRQDRLRHASKLHRDVIFEQLRLGLGLDVLDKICLLGDLLVQEIGRLTDFSSIMLERLFIKSIVEVVRDVLALFPWAVRQGFDLPKDVRVFDISKERVSNWSSGDWY